MSPQDNAVSITDKHGRGLGGVAPSDSLDLAELKAALIEAGEEAIAEGRRGGEWHEARNYLARLALNSLPALIEAVEEIDHYKAVVEAVVEAARAASRDIERYGRFGSLGTEALRKALTALDEK